MKLENYHIIGKQHEERISPLLAKIFGFELPHQCERLATAIRNLAGQKFIITIKREKRMKTRTALGFYFGGLVRAQVMDDKGLHYNPDDLRNDWQQYRKQGKVNLTDFDNADTALRIEFHYDWIKDLKGQKVKVAKELKDKDNGDLLKFIDKVMAWRAEQGYPYLDIEIYKAKNHMGKKAVVNKKDVEDFHKGLEVPEGKPNFDQHDDK